MLVLSIANSKQCEYQVISNQEILKTSSIDISVEMCPTECISTDGSCTNCGGKESCNRKYLIFPIR